MTNSLADNDQAELAEKQRLANEIVTYSDKYAGEGVIVKIGGDVVGNDESMANIATDIDYMVDKLGMRPIIFTGGGPQIDAALEDRKIPVRKHPQTSYRITDAQTLQIVREQMNNQLDRFNSIFNRHAPNTKILPMHGFTSRIARAELLADHEYTGEVTSVDQKAFEALLNGGFTPVLSSLAYHPEQGSANINADTFAGQVAQALGVKRILILTNTDGIWDENKVRIKTVELHEAEDLLKKPYIQGGAKPKLKSLYNTVSSMPAGSSGSIVNGHRARAMLMELLFENGSGTQMSKPKYTATHTPG